MVRVEELQQMQQKISVTSSKGNQNKWYRNGRWYKEDGLGYEALAEVVVSRLLQKTTVTSFAAYEYEILEKNGKNFHGCVSADFMENEDDKIISIERLFQAYVGQSAAKEILMYTDIKDRICFVVEKIEEITGLEKFGEYLKEVLTADALFFNEDRHFHNLAVIRKKDGTFRLCPLFDNGAALFSDVISDYPLTLSAEECIEKIQAKPFSADFDEQIDACELAFPGRPFQAWFTGKDVCSILEGFRGIYADEVLQRVEETIRIQMRKYSYLFHEI